MACKKWIQDLTENVNNLTQKQIRFNKTFSEKIKQKRIKLKQSISKCKSVNLRYSEDIEMADNEISADQAIFKFIPPSDLSSDKEMTPSDCQIISGDSKLELTRHHKEEMLVQKTRNISNKQCEVSEVKLRDECLVHNPIEFTPVCFKMNRFNEKRQRVDISCFLPGYQKDQDDEFAPLPFDEIELQLKIITGAADRLDNNKEMLQINQNIRLKRGRANSRVPFQVLEERDTSKQHAEFRRKIHEQEIKDEEQQRRVNRIIPNFETQDESMEACNEDDLLRQMQEIYTDEICVLNLGHQNSEPAKNTTRNNQLNEDKENFLIRNAYRYI